MEAIGQYKRLRAEGTEARTAWAIANMPVGPLDWDVHGGYPCFATAEVERAGFAVSVKLEYDETYRRGEDDDLYGQILEAQEKRPEIGAVPLSSLRGCYETQHQFYGEAWYVPSKHWTLEDRIEHARKRGMSKGPAFEWALADIREEAQKVLADDSGVYVIAADVRRSDGARGTWACGGVDLLEEDPTGSPYVWEVADEVIDEAILQAIDDREAIWTKRLGMPLMYLERG